MSPKRISGVTIALAAACLAAPMAACGAGITRPAVPGDMEPPSSHKPFLIGHAIGTQNYVCFVNASGVATWVQYGPQATLFDDRGDEIATHFLSLSPEQVPAARPTWQQSRDSSAVWALTPPLVTYGEPDYVEPGAIPWLLLDVVGAQYGTPAGHKLSWATHIQRVNTAGGVAPAGGCGAAGDVGRKVLVPYLADYVFYRP